MKPSYSLEYYESICAGRQPAFWEIVSVMADELSEYARNAEAAVEVSRWEALAELRHTHRALVQNLRCPALSAAEDDVRKAVLSQVDVAGAVERLATVARAVSKSLTSERRQADPGLPPLVPGG